MGGRLPSESAADLPRNTQTNSSQSASTGGITAQLAWSPIEKTTTKTLASAPVGVATVRISISASDMTTIQKDFTAASGSGTIDGVLSGTGRSLTAKGLDVNGTVVYQGTAANLTVQAGQTTNAGTITMAAVVAPTPTYSFNSRWPSQQWYFNRPDGISIDGSGNIYVFLYGRIQKYDSNGSFVTSWNGNASSLTESFAVESGGNVYMTDNVNSQIQKFTSSGVFITEWGSNGSLTGQFDDIRGIAIDSSGNVYVSDNGNHRIQKFTSNGVFVSSWNVLSCAGIAIDSSGNVYVSNIYITSANK